MLKTPSVCISILFLALASSVQSADITDADRRQSIEAVLSGRHRPPTCEWWKIQGPASLPILSSAYKAEARIWKRVRIAEATSCFGNHPEAVALRSEIERDESKVVRAALTRVEPPVGLYKTSPEPAAKGNARVITRKDLK